MIYLAWYLGIGGVVLVVVYGAHRLEGRDALSSKSELLDALHPERKTLRYRVLRGLGARADLQTSHSKRPSNRRRYRR